MVLSEKAKGELQEIMRRDYDVSIQDDQANQLGVSLLRLTRIARTTLARAGELSLVRSGKRRNPLGPNTSV